VRVTSPWAGNNYGGIQIPRIGQEVIVDFLNSDYDVPYVASRLVNPDHMPLWELPSQRALSGFKSKVMNAKFSVLVNFCSTMHIHFMKAIYEF
jgi:type VI secretion system secreted protein VgrG